MRRFKPLMEIGNNSSTASNTSPNLRSLSPYFCLALGKRRYRDDRGTEKKIGPEPWGVVEFHLQANPRTQFSTTKLLSNISAKRPFSLWLNRIRNVLSHKNIHLNFTWHRLLMTILWKKATPPLSQDSPSDIWKHTPLRVAPQPPFPNTVSFSGLSIYNPAGKSLHII